MSRPTRLILTASLFLLKTPIPALAAQIPAFDHLQFQRRQETTNNNDTDVIDPVCGRGGFNGYYACPIDSGGGCCPVGFACGLNDCLVVASTAGATGTTASELTATLTLPVSGPTKSLVPCEGHAGYFACPAGLGDGCCPGGYICDAKVDCQLTLKLSVTTIVTTTTEMSGTVPWTIRETTLTSVVGDGVTAVGRVGLPVSPSIVTTDATPEKRLSGGQIAGIVVGVIAFIGLLVVVAFFVMRHRRRSRGNNALQVETGSHGSDAGGKPELEAKSLELCELQTETDACELVAIETPQELGSGGKYHPEGVYVYELPADSEPRFSCEKEGAGAEKKQGL